MKTMNKVILVILTLSLLVGAVFAVGMVSMAQELPFVNLYEKGSVGYTAPDGLVYTSDYVSSKPVSVTGGMTLWFGPCQPQQYFHLVGFNGEGEAVTEKIRGKDLTVVDTFAKGSVIYSYNVPEGVTKLVFSADASLADVFSVSATELTELTWRAYWIQMGKDANSFVGQSSSYEVAAGDKLYFGAITVADAKASVLYNSNGQVVGNIQDVEVVASFGGDYKLVCYTVPEGVAYVRVAYDAAYEQYYTFQKNAASGAAFLEHWIDHIGIQLPLESTVQALSGKTALFLGDSITYGARDRANIYASGSWAGRIGYYAGMDVTNNGVSGACITTGRLESHSEKHYILNNLLSTAGTEYDYVIMHGLFNDASLPATVGSPMGKAAFDPDKANVEEFAQALELLFYTARKQNPNATLGYIVNFQTERAVDQLPYVNMAISICENWGIEYLDLYNMEGFTVTFDDGLHPDSAGYDSMYTVVANWMATLGNGAAKAATKVMSYNVYYGADVSDGKGFTIENRYLKVAQKIAAEAPEIAVLQEVTDAFKTVALPVLDGYAFYGQSHPDTDEAAPVIWKDDLYTLVESGTVTTGTDWCASEKQYVRAINYVVLQDKASGSQALVMSVHGQPDKDGVMNHDARTKTMALVVETVKAVQAKYEGIAVIVGGDFNMAVGSDAHSTLTQGGLMDVRAAVNPNSIGSYSDWDRAENKFALGDYLFVTGDVNAMTYQVLTDDLDTGRSDGLTVHISDHCPLVMHLIF